MKFFQVLILSLLFSTLFSQEKNSISGTISDTDGFSVQYANIAAVNQENQEIYSVITDENGTYSLQLPSGTYKVTTDAIGYSTKTETKKFKANEIYNVLLKVGQELEAVVVEGEKPLYRFELDKKVYDVSQDLSAKGSSLSDVLQNVPSVSVDIDGTINLRGNSNVKFLIDGKPSSMLGLSNSADVLKTIPASSIERIEVITNPSSRYEAEGTAGILNIIMKKGSQKGFNGNIETHVGYQTNIGAQANLNWQKEKWGFFFNPGVNYSEPEGKSTVLLKTYDEFYHLDSITEQDAKRVRKPFTYNFATGAHVDLSDKDLLSAAFSYRKNTLKNTNNINYYDYDANDQLINYSNRFEAEDESDYSVEGNLNYDHNFNDKGKKLSLGFSAQKSEEDELADISENGVLADRSINYEDQNSYVVNADYINPFKEGANFEVGYLGKYTSNENNFNVQSLNASNVWIDNSEFTDNITYKEQIQAFYSQYGNTFGKISFQIGLRSETTDIEITSALSNEVIEKNYTGLFPTAFFNYNFNDNNQVQVNYSRRINRPRGRFLSPFFTFADERNTFRGNPDLDPSYTHSFEVGYNWKKGKLSVFPQLFYKSTQDEVDIYVQQLAVEIDSDTLSVFVAQPYNVGVKDEYGLEVGFQYAPFKWWKMFGEFSVYRYEQKGNDDFTFLSASGTTFSGRLNSSFKLPSKIDMQVQSFFRGQETNAQSIRKAMFGMNLGLSKDILQDKATLTLNVQDVFNSRRRNILTSGAYYERDLNMQWRQRQINLSFTYRFNQKKKQERNKESEGGSEEGMGM